MEVDIICRQTNYTREEAVLKLTELGDYIKVIKDYMKIPDPIPEVKQPYRELNNFMNLKNRPTL
jgi:hypothetical protein